MAVYETRTPASVDEYMKEVARGLGLKGEVLRDGEGKLALRDRGGDIEQQTLVMFEASGGFYYRFDKQLHAVPEKQPRLPDEAAAFDIAVRYLEARGLLPKDAVVDERSVDFDKPRLVQFEKDSGRTVSELATSIEVRFRQTWDGFQVTGPGSKLYVALGAEGKVLGVTKMWRQGVRTNASLPTITPQQAIELLQKGQGRLSAPNGCQTARIEAMTLAYWSESPHVSQRTAIPVYQISGSCQDSAGKALGEFEGYAPAVMDQEFRLNTKPPRPDPAQDDEK